jgi:hypothetical protein
MSRHFKATKIMKESHEIITKRNHFMPANSQNKKSTQPMSHNYYSTAMIEVTKLFHNGPFIVRIQRICSLIKKNKCRILEPVLNFVQRSFESSF